MSESHIEYAYLAHSVMDPSNTISLLKQSNELLDAQAHIWNHTFSFLNSMALKCAIQLGIPDAIQNNGKPITLTELANSLAIHPTKASSLSRLMRLLCHSNFFSTTKLPNKEVEFDLTMSSRLLLKDHPLTQAPFVLGALDIVMTDPAHDFASWLKDNKKDDSPFHVVHGRSMWEHAGLVPEFNDHLNQIMASDARFVASLLMTSSESKGLFEGLDSLVDVGGGDGTMAKTIAKAYPELRCIVLDLPHVVEGLQTDDNNGKNLVYVGGDMFQAVPSANAILLKWILHDWSDENCIKILEQCKEAIPSKDLGGKVIIIDMVVRNQNDHEDEEYFSSQILFDMELMSVTIGGKERTEKEWKKLFITAGFKYYKISHVLGPRSVIEVYI